MKTLSILLAYIVIICAVILPICTIWHCVNVNCTTSVIIYLSSCLMIFCGIIIYMMYTVINIVK